MYHVVKCVEREEETDGVLNAFCCLRDRRLDRTVKNVAEYFILLCKYFIYNLFIGKGDLLQRDDTCRFGYAATE